MVLPPPHPEDGGRKGWGNRIQSCGDPCCPIFCFWRYLVCSCQITRHPGWGRAEGDGLPPPHIIGEYFFGWGGTSLLPYWHNRRGSTFIHLHPKSARDGRAMRAAVCSPHFPSLPWNACRRVWRLWGALENWSPVFPPHFGE